MGKVNIDLLNSCTAENCCTNELVILPLNGDVGFEEYFDHKAKQVIKAKSIFSPEEQNKLMLAYPAPDSKIPYVFERFFDSPVIVARNHVFEGCFAIDISDYIGKTNEDAFGRLMTYMHSNPDTVYVLFMYSDNKNEIDGMYDFLSRYDEIRLVRIPLPEPKVLVEYTTDKIYDFSTHINPKSTEILNDYFSKNNGGYDMADYLIRYLKNSGYDGEPDPLKEAIANVDPKWNSVNGGSNFGY